MVHTRPPTDAVCVCVCVGRSVVWWTLCALPSTTSIHFYWILFFFLFNNTSFASKTTWMEMETNGIEKIHLAHHAHDSAVKLYFFINIMHKKFPRARKILRSTYYMYFFVFLFFRLLVSVLLIAFPRRSGIGGQREKNRLMTRERIENCTNASATSSKNEKEKERKRNPPHGHVIATTQYLRWSGFICAHRFTVSKNTTCKNKPIFCEIRFVS